MPLPTLAKQRAVDACLRSRLAAATLRRVPQQAPRTRVEHEYGLRFN
jgi:hypothetical protein